MTAEQRQYIEVLQNSSANMESVEEIGDVVVVKLSPNLLCFVERNGESKVTTGRK